MKRSLPAVTVALVAMAAASVAFAGDDVTSLSYISYLERYATLHPAHDQETLDAVVNMPVLTGDRLETSRAARVEIQLADGSTVWVDEFTTLDFDSLALSRDDPAAKTALYLSEGTVAVEIPAIAAGDGAMRFDSPAGTLYLDRPGLYRMDLSGNEIHVQSYSGLAELPVGVGSEILRGGQEATVSQDGTLDKATLSDFNDDFWNWVQERRHPSAGSTTAQYVDTRDAGRAAVLDNYGDWVYEPTFSSWMWRPRVSVGWVPYSYGRWYWTPVGWDWISYEPWGWYPFHYGSWYLSAQFGWVWGWDPVWSPAWVYWIYTPGYVGWCPRGYYDWWYWHQYRGAGGPRFPRRWSEVTFDFSGRVRLGRIDPRPWTFVPSNQFGRTNVERVRLNPGRFLGGLPSDRTGIVRSGPMVTPLPSRGLPERGFDSFFRLGANQREVPDLSSVLRREPESGIRTATRAPILTPSRTVDLGPVPRVRISMPPSRTIRDSGSVPREGTGQRIGTPNRSIRDGARSEVQPRRVITQGTNPPPVVRREAQPRSDQGPRAAPPRENVRRERPPASPPGQRRNESSAWMPERDSGTTRGTVTIQNERWSPSGARREVRPRTYEPANRAQPRWQPRNVESSRMAVPRVVTRSSTGYRQSVSSARSAPAPRVFSRASAPRSASSPRGGGHPRH
jgi:hypothetical protein